VSKTPAPKVPPKKTAVAGKAAAGVSASAKATKVAAKKAAAKPVAATKKVMPPKKAAPAHGKPAAAPAPAARAKPAAAPVVAAKPTLVPKPPTAIKPAPAPVVNTAPMPDPTTGIIMSKRTGRNASKYPAPAAQAPLPPPTSRFADRFAPPRPPTRQMNSNLELDTPRQPHKSDPKLANAWKSKAGRDLTEAEVLAMPESEYMNDKQLEFFRVKLQSLKDDLLSNAGETTEHLREDTSIVPDPADRATIEEEHALELRTRDRERKLLKKISQSLQRLDSGDYGFCDETGEPIGLGRLIARPTATLSLEAQQRRELKQKMFGD
jgi:DnaK suppressor protein